MTRLADIGLQVLQWLLIAWGLVLILIAFQLRALDDAMVTAMSEQVATAQEQDTYYLSLGRQRFVSGVATGLIAVGLGALLIRLRQLYLRRGLPV